MPTQNVSNLIYSNIDSLLGLAGRVSAILLVIYVVSLTLVTIFRQGPVRAFMQLFTLRVLIPLSLTLGINTMSLALVFVQPSTVAVVISLVSPGGVRPYPLTAGIHLIIPFVENEVIYPVYFQTYTMASRPDEGNVFGEDSIRARTRDGQEVKLDTSVIFRIRSPQVVQVHIDWQERYIEDLIRPTIRGLVRTEVSQFTVQEVNSDVRKDLEATVERLLRNEFALKGFELDQFLLRDVTFSDEYAAAIERKQVALEDQEQALFDAEAVRRRADGEADAIELIAEAEAAAIRLRAEAQATAIILEAGAQARSVELQGFARATALAEVSAPLENNRDLLTYYYIDNLADNISFGLLPSNNPFLFPLPALEGNVSAADLLMTPGPESTAEARPSGTPTPPPSPTMMPTPSATP